MGKLVVSLAVQAGFDFGEEMAQEWVRPYWFLPINIFLILR